jgi:hypothetical protein
MIEYIKWLSIARLWPQDPLDFVPPVGIINEMWTMHVQLTKNYAAVCEILCCEMIHHRPHKAPEMPNKWTVAHIRQMEPFTELTAAIWKCPMQSCAFNYPSCGAVQIKIEFGVKYAPYNPSYTIQDVLIKANVTGPVEIVTLGEDILPLHSTLQECGVKKGDILKLSRAPCAS